MNRLLVASAVILTLFACLAASAEATPPSEEAKTLAQAQNQFALNLFAQLRKGDENLFLSPFSISQALALTTAGARGETAAELLKCLRLDGLAPDRLHPSMGELRRDLLKEQKGCRLAIANGLWTARGEPVSDAYLKLARDQYDAEPTALDFAGAAEESRAAINAWIGKRTNDLIKDMLKPGSIKASTALVLANAVYLKAGWCSEFEKKATTSQYFHVRPEKKVAVPMMRQMIYFQYMEDKECQVLEMPYLGEQLSFVMLLPRDKNGLADLEKTLTLESLNARLAGLQKTAVRVTMPRFKLKSEVDLIPALANMGVKRAFDGAQADFSGIHKGKLFIDLVCHSAYVDVNEEGTEAAAATVVAVAKNGGGHPTIFNADHPFLFLIRDKRTGALVFLGRFIEPTERAETEPREDTVREHGGAKK